MDWVVKAISALSGSEETDLADTSGPPPSHQHAEPPSEDCGRPSHVHGTHNGATSCSYGMETTDHGVDDDVVVSQPSKLQYAGFLSKEQFRALWDDLEKEYSKPGM